MEPEDKHELIERYLNQSLNENELMNFEQRLKNDPAFAQEVDQYTLLIDHMNLYGQRKNLKKQLDNFHEELHLEVKPIVSPPRKIRRPWKRYIPVAVAASVLLIVGLTSLFTLDNVRSLEEQQTSQYKTLRREVNIVKKKQARIALNQKAEKRKENKSPAKQYGATAFVVSSNGYLVTNYHVIDNADSIYVEGQRERWLRFQVEEVLSDARHDLTILRIVDSSFIGFAELPYTFRNEEADLAEPVYTLAYPRRDMVYGEGSISALSGYKGDTITYQISIPVNPGNSGGPLLDEYGNLLGIVSGKNTDMDGAAFAIKARYLKEMADSLNLNPEILPVLLPQNNTIHYLPRHEQVKKLKDFVFVVRVVYNSKG